jgi:diacylglycerol kinase (ATP)
MGKTTSGNSWRRLWNATGYSLKGLRAAFIHEQAFRLEVYILVFLAPLVFYLTDSHIEQVLLLGSWLIVMMAELVNSAVEAVVDRVGSERHELSGRAKDVGSAAVMLALVMATITWALILGPRYLS